MKQKAKDLLKKMMPFPVTRNQKYDRDTKKIFRKVLKADSNTIDVGCHKGEVLKEILKVSPEGKHFGVEPIPFLADQLRKKLPGNCTVLEYALDNKGEGESEFVHVKSNPAYSGLKERSYEKKEELETIRVKTARLDQVVPDEIQIDLIKIDVEGAELGVMEGAEEILRKDKPVIIFEHGLGASDKYETTPEDIFSFLNLFGYKISTMDSFLKNGNSFTKEKFADQYFSKKNYYFIAW